MNTNGQGTALITGASSGIGASPCPVCSSPLQTFNPPFPKGNTGDGIYDNGGDLIRGDSGSKARFIGTQVEVVLEYECSRDPGFLVSYSQFRPGRFINDTGPGKTVHFVGTELI